MAVKNYFAKVSEESEQQVKTHDGKFISRKNAIYLPDDAVYAEMNDPKVIKDCFSGRFQFMKNCNQIVNKFDMDGNPTYESCSYTRSPEKACELISKNKGAFYTVYESIPLDLYVEDYTTGIFYHNSIPTSKYQKEHGTIYRKAKNAYSYSTGDLKKDYLMGIKSPSFKITEGKRYKFGLELETIYGRLPYYLDNYLNYNAVHDGSLRGPNGEDPVGAEYVTGVLTGDTGFLQSKRLAVEVTRRCKIDKKCGEMLATL